MKKLLYIGHEYHIKTKSTAFLVDLFRRDFDVEYMTYDDQSQEFKGAPEAFDRDYDILVLFQMPVSVKLLKEKFKFKHGAYFPMYDGTGEAPDSFWLDYQEFNIINFSLTLHNRLKNMGFSTFYIQFFPKPSENIIQGRNDSAFFWQRRDVINIHTVSKLLKKTDIKKIHIHKAVDPGQTFWEPNEEEMQQFDFSYSTWYEQKSDMISDMQKAATYIAPREYEGIGMSFLEAMAYGKCVIAPNHPTMNEYIQNGYNGYLYDCQNVESLEDIDVSKIQKNTMEYMHKGYEQWEKHKYDILEWIQKDIKVDAKKMESVFRNDYVVSKRYIFKGEILLLTIDRIGTYRLFGKIILSQNVVACLKNIKHLIKKK